MFGLAWDDAYILHTNRKEGCTTNAMDSTAAGGHLAIVEFLHTNRKEGCTTNAIDSAAAGGRVAVIEFLAKLLYLFYPL